MGGSAQDFDPCFRSTEHPGDVSWNARYRRAIDSEGTTRFSPAAGDGAHTCWQWYRFGDAKIDAVSDFTKLTLDSKSHFESKQLYDTI